MQIRLKLKPKIPERIIYIRGFSRMLYYRHMTSVFLNNGYGQYLMLKRSKSKEIAPELWTGLGGHIESNEYTDPYKACIREIFEESGIEENDIFNLKLRYIMISRKNQEEIRQHYVFFGTTAKMEVESNSEGRLHWIPAENILDLEMPQTLKEVIEHYNMNKFQINDNLVWVGITKQTAEGNVVTWGMT
jgi:8-oxo-dGTP diphosphatase